MECMGKCSLMIRNKTLTFSLGKASECIGGSCRRFSFGLGGAAAPLRSAT
jgi:hypothetical protein